MLLLLTSFGTSGSPRSGTPRPATKPHWHCQVFRRQSPRVDPWLRASATASRQLRSGGKDWKEPDPA